MERAVHDVLDQLVIIGCGVKLGVIVSTVKCESTYHVWISSHVDLDEPCWGRDSMFIGDGEGDKIVSDVVDESLGWFNQSNRTSCCCVSVSRGGKWLYRFGSHNSSCLSSSLSLTYVHPLGRPFIRWDERGCQYFDGIFVVFIDKSGNLSCQCGNVHMCEVNSGHFSVYWHGWGLDKYGCDWCWYWDGIGGFVSVAILHGSVALTAVSIIWLVVMI